MPLTLELRDMATGGMYWRTCHTKIARVTLNCRTFYSTNQCAVQAAIRHFIGIKEIAGVKQVSVLVVANRSAHFA